MPKTIELFMIDELDNIAYLDAIEDMRNEGWTWQDYDTDILTDYFEVILEEDYAIVPEDLYWSLGYCKSDYVQIYKAYIEDWDKFFAGLMEFYSDDSVLNGLDAETIENLKLALGGIYKNRIDGNSYYLETDKEEELLDELIKETGHYLEHIAQQLSEIGYNEIDYKYSEEYLKETALANDLYFTEKGKLMWGY